MKKVIIGIVSGILFAISACVRQPSYSNIPLLTGINVSTTLLKLNPAGGYSSDSILLSVNFKDGDGDIGPVDGTTPTSVDNPSNHANDSAVITDPAYDVYWYMYQSGDSFIDHRATEYIANNAKYKALQGVINVYPVLECPPTGNIDTVYFSVFIKDRAGHVSNRLRTPGIVVNCQ